MRQYTSVLDTHFTIIKFHAWHVRLMLSASIKERLEKLAFGLLVALCIIHVRIDAAITRQYLSIEHTHTLQTSFFAIKINVVHQTPLPFERLIKLIFRPLIL